MDQLDQLSLPLASRREIVAHFWDMNNSTNPSNPGHDDPYFAYFEKQCRLALQHDDAEDPACTQRNICDIVQQLKAGDRREKIREGLALKSRSDSIHRTDGKFLDRAIDLAVRLWLMVHVGHVHLGVTKQTAITWCHGALQPVLATYFHHELILTDQVKLERVFNAMNIERIADVKIRWTPNLVDHLRFLGDGKRPVLNIFYHAAFLNYHKDKYVS